MPFLTSKTENRDFKQKDTKINSKKTYLILRLWKYMYEYKWLLFIAAVLSIGSNLFALIGPALSGYAVDAIVPGVGKVDFPKVYYYALLMLLFYIASAVMTYFLSRIMIKLSRSVVYKMRKDVFNRLVTLPVGFFDRRQTGDIISIISYDIDTINTSLSNDLLQVLTSIITVVGSFVMMLSISKKLILVFAFTVPASILFTRYRTKKVRPLFRIRSSKLGELNGFIEEMTGGRKTIKAYHQEKTILDRFDEKNTHAVDAYFKADYYSSMTGPSMNFINNLSLALISIFGSILYMAGSLSLGNISSFVLYSRKFSGPINEFANIIGELQSSFAAAERVFRLIDEPAEPADTENAVTLTDIFGNVKFENVSFGYEKGKEILHKLNLDAPKGSVIAIVGPTGAGKTTIINLLMRFYDVDSGKISIDGLDIKKVTRESLRKAYTMVLQDTWLFHGTIFENIAYGKENVTLDEVINAAKAAKIHNYIMSLPKGYDTILSDNGVNISKGQKQLLTIARAMLLDSKMLILDEATSNVDTQTEHRIQDAMLKLMKNRTCFVIAHRLSTIKNADTILVVREGNIVEQGTHSELMRSRGFYYDLYHSQYVL
ncbi:ABC transporter ATP-binding protein [Anaeropeptidivorans aminofermentans]|uniref:ABC transporter ATP-binding protein n=1 Tax=Anaeropeptidivorans aminofermentans TaxID=2934315 RepID=UPI002025150D|nr:ABC transporter ATP-binding protein [Anaeropeptidivorans aminofermentans]